MQQKSRLHFNLIKNNLFFEKPGALLNLLMFKKILFNTCKFPFKAITNKKFMLFSTESCFINYKIFSLHKILCYEQRNK